MPIEIRVIAWVMILTGLFIVIAGIINARFLHRTPRRALGALVHQTVSETFGETGIRVLAVAVGVIVMLMMFLFTGIDLDFGSPKVEKPRRDVSLKMITPSPLDPSRQIVADM